MEEPDLTNYAVNARGYLARTRSRLLEASPESLFYAALELRCCVEARQAEYLEHLDHYKGQKVRPYKIGENRAKVAKICRGDVISKLTFTLGDDSTFTAYHTPVPSSLSRYCERQIDQLRHAQSIFREPGDAWWTKTRAELISNYRLAWVSCQGDLMVPPLWGRDKKSVHPMVFSFTPENRIHIEQMIASVGGTFNVYVDYLERPPGNWKCDL